MDRQSRPELSSFRIMFDVGDVNQKRDTTRILRHLAVLGTIMGLRK